MTIFRFITLGIFLLSIMAGTTAVASAGQIWNGVFRDVAGRPLADLALHCWRPNGAVWEHRTTTTAADGSWSIELPEGNWRIAARPDELLARGYFCMPGFVIGVPATICEFSAEIDPVTGVFEVVPCVAGSRPVWEILLGPGVIEWQPAPTEGPVNLTAVPTRPTLTVLKSAADAATIRLDFETQAVLPMQVTRRWRVEKSTDLQHWHPVQTVELGQLSPIHVPDAESSGQAICYYRAAMVEDLPADP